MLFSLSPVSPACELLSDYRNEVWRTESPNEPSNSLPFVVKKVYSALFWSFLLSCRTLLHDLRSCANLGEFEKSSDWATQFSVLNELMEQPLSLRGDFDRNRGIGGLPLKPLGERDFLIRDPLVLLLVFVIYAIVYA